MDNVYKRPGNRGGKGPRGGPGIPGREARPRNRLGRTERGRKGARKRPSTQKRTKGSGNVGPGPPRVADNPAHNLLKLR